MKVAAWLGRVMLAWLLLATPVHAQMYPKPIGYVSDFASILLVSERATLAAELVAFEKETTSQIVVVTTDELSGQTIDAYTRGLARQWRPGTRRDSNGVVLLVSPSIRKFRIEVGTGLERVITPSRIIAMYDGEMIPYFRRGQWGEGLRHGSRALMLMIRQDRDSR